MEISFVHEGTQYHGFDVSDPDTRRQLADTIGEENLEKYIAASQKSPPTFGRANGGIECGGHGDGG